MPPDGRGRAIRDCSVRETQNEPIDQPHLPSLAERLLYVTFSVCSGFAPQNGKAREG